MSPAEIRSHRLQELQRLVKKLHKEGKSPDEIIKALRKRANQMARRLTAKEYVAEIIARNSS